MCKITHTYLAYILTFIIFSKNPKKFVCVGLPKNTPKNEKIFSLLLYKNYKKLCQYNSGILNKFIYLFLF